MVRKAGKVGIFVLLKFVNKLDIVFSHATIGTHQLYVYIKSDSIVDCF